MGKDDTNLESGPGRAWGREGSGVAPYMLRIVSVKEPSHLLILHIFTISCRLVLPRRQTSKQLQHLGARSSLEAKGDFLEDVGGKKKA